MNTIKLSQWVIILIAILLLLVGCGGKAPAQQPTGVATSTPILQSFAPIDYFLVPMDCIVSHSGWEGIVAAPGVTKPTSGIVVAFECNGKDVEISNKTIADGYIETKDFGKIGIRFRSQVQTIGAGEYMQLAEGISLPEQAIEIYILSSMLKDFTNRYSK